MVVQHHLLAAAWIGLVSTQCTAGEALEDGARRTDSERPISNAHDNRLAELCGAWRLWRINGVSFADMCWDAKKSAGEQSNSQPRTTLLPTQQRLSAPALTIDLSGEVRFWSGASSGTKRLNEPGGRLFRDGSMTAMASTEINTQFESDFLDAMRKTDSWRRKEGILELLGGDETLLEFEINRTLLIGEWEVITPMPASQLKAADALRLRISADRKIMGRDGAQRLRGSVALTGDALFDAIRLVEPEDSEAMSEEFQDDLAELRASLESARTVLSGAGDRLLLIDRRGSVVADFAPSNLALVGTWRLECFGAGEIPEDARRPVLAISSEGLVKCRDYTKKTDMPIPRDLGSGRLDPHEYLLMTRGGRFAFRNREYVLGNDDESVVARSFRCAMARSRACVRIDDHLHVFGQKGELLMTLILIP